jgi:hypothetical protein
VESLGSTFVVFPRKEMRSAIWEAIRLRANSNGFSYLLLAPELLHSGHGATHKALEEPMDGLTQTTFILGALLVYPFVVCFILSVFHPL